MAEDTKLLLQSLLKAHDISVTGTNIKGNVLRLLSDDSSGRTNQFEVQARLSGLVEKCWIYNNDALGNALQQRLDKLPTVSNQWTPDILSLLLALSDRPVHKTRVEDLASLLSDPPAPPLTWSEIIDEDPLEDQTAVWRDIDFAADGSDEDGDSISLASGKSDDDEIVDVSKTEDAKAEFEALIVSVDSEVLEKLSKAQAWREDVRTFIAQPHADNEDAFEILEINAIREIIFMLLGLPTSIFERDDKGDLKLQRQFKLVQTSPQTVEHLINSLLAIGQKLSTIREWVKEDFHVPLEQAFQSALQTRLRDFQSALHNIQKRFLGQHHSAIVSIIDVCIDVSQSSQLIVQLHDILAQVKEVPASRRPFRILEALHDQTCVNQKVGDDEGYEYLARIFFQCFQIYLKPIHAWMETGEADSLNPIMFIEKALEEVAPQLIWQDQYRLIQSADGELKAPRFLQVAASRIFKTGKSVHFLKKLGITCSAQNIHPDTESLMGYEAVCSTVDPRNFISFPELLDTAFARWIASKQHSSSVLLRQQLESQCGLQRALMALEHIYLYSNGALSNNAVRPLFEKLELGSRRWNDSFSTIVLFHDAFASDDCIDLNRLSIRPTGSKHAPNIKGRSMDVLENLQVSYMLPWPIANIITSQSMATYQRIFIFLTQLERARFLLQRNKLPRHAVKMHFSMHTYLLWFVNTLLSHITTLVIAVNTKALYQDMNNAEDVDSMIAVHQAYIAKLEYQCFLMKKETPLRRAIVSILDLTVLFSSVQVLPASQTQKLGRSSSFSSGEEDGDASGLNQIPKLGNDVSSQGAERLKSIRNTYSQLLDIVTTSVESIRKADGGLMWTVLASNLAFGAVI